MSVVAAAAVGLGALFALGPVAPDAGPLVSLTLMGGILLAAARRRRAFR